MSDESQVNGVMSTLERGLSTTNTDVTDRLLTHLERKDAQQAGILDRLFDMFKGKSVARAPIRDEEGSADDRPSRGEGMSFKGYMCKGDDCGHRVLMAKGHPHFGKKRQVADELGSEMRCPRCHSLGVNPIMEKGEEELEDDMDKGVMSGPDVDNIFRRLYESTDSLTEGVSTLPSMAQMLMEQNDMLKGMPEAFTDRLVALEEHAEENRVFQQSMAGAFQAFSEGQDTLREMLKGFGDEVQEMLKGISPAAIQRVPSAFDAATERQRSMLPPPTEMVKGEDVLTDAELAKGVSRGIISDGDCVVYRRGGTLPNGIERSAAFFRKQIQ